MNWFVLTSLNNIYNCKQVNISKTMNNDPDIQHLLDHTGELVQFAGQYIKGDGFDRYYQLYHLANYTDYHEFLSRYDLLTPHCRFAEFDIQLLMEVESGRLSRGPYLGTGKALTKALEKILGRVIKGTLAPKIYIHPFRQAGGRCEWDGDGARYVWGSHALALGRHFDNYNESDEWSSELGKLENELIEVATAERGYAVGLIAEYI